MILEADMDNKSTSAELPAVLTAEEVAKLTRTHISSVYRHAASGRYPSIRVGGALRFPTDSLLTVITEEKK